MCNAASATVELGFNLIYLNLNRSCGQYFSAKHNFIVLVGLHFILITDNLVTELTAVNLR